MVTALSIWEKIRRFVAESKTEARLEGFEPPTLGSVGVVHDQQLGEFVQNVIQIA
jgi:hypothetical protein